MNRLDITRHPCFNANVKGKYGRIHLPVAGECNIKCNYCNRKYDCVNESRPGVSSALLSPEQALLYLERAIEKAPFLSVAGIAGPGDAFATPDTTLRVIELVRERFPELLLCVATNGLNVEPYVGRLAELRTSHVTVTVNAVDPEIGAKIYRWARSGKVVFRGQRAAELLLERQLSAIRALKAAGMTVKVNTVVIPGINDHHVLDVSRRMAEFGVDIQNCMAMCPNEGTPFADIPEASPEAMKAVRGQAEDALPQMRHCARCRADAVGLLAHDCAGDFRHDLLECSRLQAPVADARPYVAVATLEGALVNLHLGEAPEFQIWGESEDGFRLIETRPAPEPGLGPARWTRLAETLEDCRAVLVSALGETPDRILRERGVLPVEMSGLITMGLEAVFHGANPALLKGRRKFAGCARAASGCVGDGTGCG
jgi:nitrogen fixation protein NifB